MSTPGHSPADTTARSAQGSPMSATLPRRAALVALGAAAAASGAGWYWWRERSAAAADARAAVVWTRRFPRPQGGELVLADFRGRPLILNFWATWCAPCVREMPALQRFHLDHGAKAQLAGIALDSAAPVNAFLKQHAVDFPIGLAGLEGTELLRQLGNDKGLLPYTVVFDAAGHLVHRKLGETSAADLQAWLAGF